MRKGNGENEDNTETRTGGKEHTIDHKHEKDEVDFNYEHEKDGVGPGVPW